jgi:hypothetical protein
MNDGILLGDIGGTHSRFALLGEDGRPREARAFQNNDFGRLQDVIAQYLKETGAAPAQAVLAFAGPLTGPEIALTNRGWRFRLDDLKAQFGLGQIRAVNDFEAQAWALPLLGAADLQHIGGPADTANGCTLRCILARRFLQQRRSSLRRAPAMLRRLQRRACLRDCSGALPVTWRSCSRRPAESTSPAALVRGWALTSMSAAFAMHSKRTRPMRRCSCKLRPI